MKVTLKVYDRGKAVEEYTALDGSWVRTETCGMQHLDCVLEPVRYRWREDIEIELIPHNPPKVPENILCLVNSDDPKWGRNGIEYLGCHRESQGGTGGDRVREYLCKYREIWRAQRSDLALPVPVPEDLEI
jgi:hypothetical protein